MNAHTEQLKSGQADSLMETGFYFVIFQCHFVQFVFAKISAKMSSAGFFLPNCSRAQQGQLGGAEI